MADTLRYLLDLGVNARQIELEYGWTVLHSLFDNREIDYDEMLESVELLLSHDPSLASIPNKDGFTPLTFELCDDESYDEIDISRLAILRALAKAEAEQRRKSK